MLLPDMPKTLVFLFAEEGCRRCLPGWNFLDSMCYFFAFSLAQRQWNDARNFCKKYGGNLATVDTYEKNVRPQPDLGAARSRSVKCIILSGRKSVVQKMKNVFLHWPPGPSPIY